MENLDYAFTTFYVEEDPVDEMFDPWEVKDAFFEFISSLMKNYKKFLVNLLIKKKEIIEKLLNKFFN